MTFALASCQSCQSWGDGHYVAYADMASRAPDVVIHVGDYIYEKPIPARGGRRDTTLMPASATSECLTLDDYRERYALYRLDPNLQRAHATSPFITMFDDHEVDNNWAADIPEYGMPVPAFLLRRAAGIRAWWENTPVRVGPPAASSSAETESFRAFRRFGFGDLAQFHVLDTRSYRSDQVNGDIDTAQNARTADPRRTITGDAQERRLLDGVAAHRGRWTILAHPTPMADLARRSADERAVSMDGWSGYEASRTRVLDGLTARGAANIVSVTGDIHRNVVADLRTDYTRPSRTVGVEIAGTSITYGGDGEDSDASDRALKAGSPHVRFGNAQRGYVLNG